jgi:hypothetical protein
MDDELMELKKKLREIQERMWALNPNHWCGYERLTWQSLNHHAEGLKERIKGLELVGAQ